MIADNQLYITDPDKIVRVIDLKTALPEPAQSFEKYYKRFKHKPNEALTTHQQIETPFAPNPGYFPNLLNRDTTALVLAKYIHRKAVSLASPDYQKYKVYRVNIGAYFSRDGNIQIAKLEADKTLPLDSITAFFKSQRYNMSYLPNGLDKWYVSTFYWFFRNPSDAKALEEKQQEDKEQALARERRMTQDTINGVYIPKNLEECLIALDKSLPPVAKNEIKALKTSFDMFQYHFGIGTWIRNSFGLWGGSR
jgi:hypothetical protein